MHKKTGPAVRSDSSSNDHKNSRDANAGGQPPADMDNLARTTFALVAEGSGGEVGRDQFKALISILVEKF